LDNCARAAYIIITIIIVVVARGGRTPEHCSAIVQFVPGPAHAFVAQSALNAAWSASVHERGQQ
jgi:hypothetical protein